MQAGSGGFAHRPSADWERERGSHSPSIWLNHLWAWGNELWKTLLFVPALSQGQSQTSFITTAVSGMFARNNCDFNAGMVFRTPALRRKLSWWSKTDLDYLLLNEDNEQKVSDTPCLSVIAGLFVQVQQNLTPDSLPSIHSPEGPG